LSNQNWLKCNGFNESIIKAKENLKRKSDFRTIENLNGLHYFKINKRQRVTNK
jgi:hypothetical protein